MLQNKFEMPLDLEIKPSKLFSFYLIIILLLALTSILLLTTLPFGLRMLLILLLIVMTVFIYKELKNNRVSHLRLTSSGEWELESSHIKYTNAELTGECIVTYFFIWLNFSVVNAEGKKKIYHTLLASDSLDENLLRQLRVRLRFMLNKDKDVIELEY